MSGNMTEIFGVRADEFFIGLLYSSMALVIIIFNIPCLIVMRTDKELKKHPCFTCGVYWRMYDICTVSLFSMMFHLGLCDVVSVVGHFISGVLTLGGWAYTFPAVLHKIYGGTLVSFGWFTYTLLCQVIALNRFVTMCFKPPLHMRLFSKKATKYWLAVCWMYGFVWWLVFMSPWGAFVYVPSLYIGYYDPTTPWYENTKTVGWFQNATNFLMSLIYYVAIFVHLRFKKKDMSQNQQSMEDKEKAILRQAAFICLYPLCWDQYYHLAPVLVAKYGFRYAYVIGNVFWLSNSGINPLVYLTMNKTISNKVRSFVTGKPVPINPSTKNKATVLKQAWAGNENAKE